MLTENLARLKELDPTTYNEYIDWIRYGKHGKIAEQDDILSGAVLQAILQEAIATRGWAVSQHQYKKCGVTIRFHANCAPVEGHADMPAVAILAAYIAALEAQG